MALRLSHVIGATIGLHVLMPPVSAAQWSSPHADSRYRHCAALATDRIKSLMMTSPSSIIRKQPSGPKRAMIEIQAFGFQNLRSVKPPASDKRPASFMQRNRCEEEPLITKAMEKLNNINLTALEDDFFNDSIGLKIRIENQQAYYSLLEGEMTRKLKKRTKYYVEFVDRLLKEVELPDMEFVVSLMDGSPGHAGVLKAEGWPGEDLLFLSRGALESWWNKDGDYMLPKCKKIRPGAVFRGSTTGGTHQWDEKNPLPLYDYSGHVLPRYRVIETSRKRPDLLDAGFTQVVQSTDNEAHTKALAARGFMKDSLRSFEQVCYEAVVVVDGNSIPDRMPEQLALATPNNNKPVVFVHNESLPADFFYEELIPWEHFVPASPDNLEEVLEALLENKNMMDCIGYNGRRFVKYRLNPNRLKCYMTQLLLGYHGVKRTSMERTGDDIQKAVVRWEGRRSNTAWEKKPTNWR